MKKILVIIIFLVVLGGLYLSFFSENKKNESFNSYVNEENTVQEIDKFDESVLYGKWQSIDDNLFIRIFENDNTFKDTYGEDGVVSNGTWFVYRSEELPSNFPYPVENGKDYLIMNDTNLSLHFMISEITKDKLSLIYLDNGSTLRFNSLK